MTELVIRPRALIGGSATVATGNPDTLLADDSDTTFVTMVETEPQTVAFYVQWEELPLVASIDFTSLRVRARAREDNLFDASILPTFYSASYGSQQWRMVPVPRSSSAADYNPQPFQNDDGTYVLYPFTDGPVDDGHEWLDSLRTGNLQTYFRFSIDGPLISGAVYQWDIFEVALTVEVSAIKGDYILSDRHFA